jgi:acetyl esterase/lipase
MTFLNLLRAAGAVALASIFPLSPAFATLATGLAEGQIQDKPPPLSWRTLKYRTDAKRKFDYHPSGRSKATPLVIFIAGIEDLEDAPRYPADWLPSLLLDKGYALAAVYDLPGRRETAPEQLDAMAQGVSELIARADELGFDPERIFLVGHGWGGGLAALIGADPSVLQRKGVDFAAVRGVAAIDGRGFDVPALSAAGSDFLRKDIARWIGDAETQQRLSAAQHLSKPNAARFCVFAVEGGREAPSQAQAFTAKLQASDVPVTSVTVKPAKWKSPETFIGNPNNPDNAPLLGCMEEALR